MSWCIQEGGSKDVLKTANFSRTRWCLKLIRSAATVYNRVRFARKMQHMSHDNLEYGNLDYMATW